MSNGKELGRKLARERAAAIKRRRGAEDGGWNGWRLEDWGEPDFEGVIPCPGGWNLVCVEMGYPVDLTRFQSSAVVLDIIMQVAKKGWGTDACIAGLVRALNDLLDPQANLCSGGEHKIMTWKTIEARAALIGGAQVMTGMIVPFGKYRGKPIEELLADRSYCDWMLAQPGIREKWSEFVVVVVNGGSAPDASTPQHNKLQTMFLDGEMVLATYRSIVGDQAISKWALSLARDEARVVLARRHAVESALQAEVDKGTCTPKKWGGDLVLVKDRVNDRGKIEKGSGWKWAKESDADKVVRACEEAGERAAEEMFQRHMKSCAPIDWARTAIVKARVQFEVSGWDVVIFRPDEWLSSGEIILELKPTLGDDYPAVLRKMKTRMGRYAGDTYGHYVLIVDRFDAEGATYDQVKKIFASSHIQVKTLAEIRALMREER
jgi:hypothetical protein